MARRSGGGFWISEDGTGGAAPPSPPFTHVVPGLIKRGKAVIRIGDPQGRVIGQLFGRIDSVSSRADGYGGATILFPSAVLREYRGLLEFGNRLRIDFNNGLRPWAGVIDVPRELSGGVLRVQAYEPAYLLSQRLTRRLARFVAESGYDAQTVARLMVLRLEGRPLTVFERAGGHAPPPPPMAAEFSFETVLDALDALRDIDPWFHYHSGCEFQVSEDGFIDLHLYVYRGAWQDATGQAVLQQGVNFTNVQILDQGPVVTRVIVATGDADVGGEGDRVDNEQPTRPPYRPNSRYSPVYYPYTAPGLMLSAQLPGDAAWPREKFVVLADVGGEDESDPGEQLERYAETYLDRYSAPARRVSGTSLNLSPGLWHNFGVGSLVRLRATDAAGLSFEQDLQVHGLDYTPAQGVLSLVLADPRLTEAV